MTAPRAARPDPASLGVHHPPDPGPRGRAGLDLPPGRPGRRRSASRPASGSGSACGARPRRGGVRRRARAGEPRPPLGAADGRQPRLGAREHPGHDRGGRPRCRTEGGGVRGREGAPRRRRPTCDQIGAHGAGLLRDGERVLTYCNTGSLATAGSGTALAIVFAAKSGGLRISVTACETRPLLQGARLTMWELERHGIEATLITDNAAATMMRQKRVDRVLVGADRIARNGDTANKIGTYGVALLAKAHGMPFHVAAPRSTFDFSLASGDQIPIEERDPSEITEVGASGSPRKAPGLRPRVRRDARRADHRHCHRGRHHFARRRGSGREALAGLRVRAGEPRVPRPHSNGRRFSGNRGPRRPIHPQDPAMEPQASKNDLAAANRARLAVHDSRGRRDFDFIQAIERSKPTATALFPSWSEFGRRDRGGRKHGH